MLEIDKKIIKRIVNLMQIYRRNTPHASVIKANPITVKQERMMPDGKIGLMYCYIFMSKGCMWALKNGGCTFCNFFIDTPYGVNVNRKIQLKQLKSLMDQDPPSGEVGLFTPGSFFDDDEVTSGARIEIAQKVSEYDLVKWVIVEGAANFINEKKIKEMMSHLRCDIKMEIALGLETANEWIRFMVVNKPISNALYERASRTIKKYCGLRFYVFLKPAFLTEKESIDDAIKSIMYADMLKADTIILQTANIKAFSFLADLYENKLYSPPKLWSSIGVVLETKNKVKNIKRILIAGLEETKPAPIAHSDTCKKCDAKVINAINKYNLTQDVKYLKDLACECKNEWSASLSEKSNALFSLPIGKRIDPILKIIENKYQDD